MTGVAPISDTLRFHCPSCRAELSVPASLAGVQGPCPSCSETIQAPIPEAVYGGTPELPLMHGMPVLFPPARELEERSPAPSTGPVFPDAGTDRNFHARLTMPSVEEDPAEDARKSRHRVQQRRTRRVRKVEKAAQRLLDSRGFQVARVVLIMLSGAMLVWLFQYLQNHQWRLPGMSPAVTDERKATGHSGKAPGSTASELLADDDTEIPPASNQVPARRPSGGPPLAGRPVP